MSNATTRTRSLMPREHGAYAQLAFPLITGLGLGRPGAAAWLLVVAAIAVFLAHEPLLVVIGGRGARAKREAASPARRRFLLLAGLALATGGPGLWLAPASARTTALIPIAFGASLVPFILARREKTTAGELLITWSLSTILIPIAIAAGAGTSQAFAAGVVWGVASSLVTITVRALIARHKRRLERLRPPVLAPALCAATIVSALYLSIRDVVPSLVALAVVPTAAAALFFGLVGVHPRKLRRVGWSFVASNLAVLAALLLGSG